MPSTLFTRTLPLNAPTVRRMLGSKAILKDFLLWGKLQDELVADIGSEEIGWGKELGVSEIIATRDLDFMKTA